MIQKRRPDGSVEHLPTFFSGLTFDGNTNVFVKTTDLTYAFIARTGNHLRLVKTGSLGEEEWHRDISNVVSFDSTETSYCLSVANDGGLLVASSIYGNIWLTKYNNSGTEIFKRLVSTGGQDFFYPTNLISLSDGNIYMSLSQINDPYYTKIYKISTGGALLLERSVLAHFEKAVEEEGRVVFYGQTRTSVFNQIPIILSYYQTFATDLSLVQPAGAYLSPGSVFDISNQFLAARIITNDCRPTYIWHGSDPYYYSNLGYFNRFVVEK